MEETNWKGKLQELLMKQKKPMPSYTYTNSWRDERPQFTSTITVQDIVLESDECSSKIKSDQNAAMQMYQRLNPPKCYIITVHKQPHAPAPDRELVKNMIRYHQESHRPFGTLHDEGYWDDYASFMVQEMDCGQNVDVEVVKTTVALLNRAVAHEHYVSYVYIP